MSIAFVTCIYNSEYITGFASTDPANGEMRWQRFYKSLSNISRTLIPIIIFTNRGNSEYLNNYCSKTFAHKNFQIIEKDLSEFEYYEPLNSLLSKTSTESNPIDINRNNRYAQLMHGKMYMVKHAIENNIFNVDKYIWIDAGLSFQSLFPDRFREGPVGEYFKYSCFNPELIKRLDEYSKEKIFVVVYSQGQGTYLLNDNLYNPPERIQDANKWYTIGGLWGGKKEQLMQMFDSYKNALFTVISSWEQKNTGQYTKLFVDEPIFSAIVCNKPENFHVEKFDTWYQEDDTSQVKNILPGMRNFYKVITGEP